MLLGIFYEGPTPPPRLAEHVTRFANDNPNATRKEWIVFAQGLANSSYQSGWLRGYEWVERELDKLPEEHPDRIADSINNNWRQNSPVLMHYTDEKVVDDKPEVNPLEFYENERRYFEDRIATGPRR